MKRYYVIQTNPGQEQIAAENLKNQRYNAYLPTLVKERQANKRFPWRGGSKIEPVFSGYMFVELDLKSDHWRSINGTRGVKRLLGETEQPTPIPDGFIETLRAMCERGAYDEHLHKPQEIRAGDRVRVESGSFVGLIGKCIQARAKNVKLLLNAFGGAVEVIFGIEKVARAA